MELNLRGNVASPRTKRVWPQIQGFRVEAEQRGQERRLVCCSSVETLLPRPLSLSPHQLSQSRPSLLVGSTSIHRNYYSSLKKWIPLSPNQLILNQEATARPYSDILTIQCMISSWASWNAHKIHVLELQTTNMVIFGGPLKISNALVWYSVSCNDQHSIISRFGWYAGPHPTPQWNQAVCNLDIKQKNMSTFTVGGRLFSCLN